LVGADKVYKDLLLIGLQQKMPPAKKRDDILVWNPDFDKAF